MNPRMLVGSGGRGLGRLLLIVGGLTLVCAVGTWAKAIASGGSGGSGLGGKKHHHRARINPLARRGMWIWELSSSNGGNVGSIIRQSHRYGVSTLIIKSGDGSSYWSQFSRGLVSTLHHHGLRACAWEFVYGNQPVAEARVGAKAVHNGADCLMIDAEGQYEGKYVQAQTYIRKLRRLVGSRYRLGLAGLPYVDYHPAFPYSVFLGRGGAQYNAPQMYWYVIGTTPDGVYSHTYQYNRIYRRPIFPLGEAVPDPPAGTPPASQVRRFRLMARAYHAANASWWVWQGLPRSNWVALSQRISSLSRYRPNTSYARLTPGAQGDLVVWAQEHLASAGQPVTIDGSFGPKTKAAVQRFQRAHRISAIGSIGPATWAALLRYRPISVTWRTRGGRSVARAAGGQTIQVPLSARLPAKRYEIPPRLGAGRPPH